MVRCLVLMAARNSGPPVAPGFSPSQVMTRDGLRKVAYRVNDDSKEARPPAPPLWPPRRIVQALRFQTRCDPARAACKFRQI